MFRPFYVRAAKPGGSSQKVQSIRTIQRTMNAIPFFVTVKPVAVARTP